MTVHHLERDVDPVLPQVYRHVLPEIRELQSRAGRIGKALPLRIGVAAEVEQQSSDGISRMLAIEENIIPGRVSCHRLIVYEGGYQVRERLLGQAPSFRC